MPNTEDANKKKREATNQITLGKICKASQSLRGIAGYISLFTISSIGSSRHFDNQCVGEYSKTRSCENSVVNEFHMQKAKTGCMEVGEWGVLVLEMAGVSNCGATINTKLGPQNPAA